ncbi:MAG: Holliday junction branch migration protein RuvA [Candidatus Saccharimonadales bacterium]
MITTLSGVIDEKIDDQLILDVNGVGYGLMVTLDDYSRFAIGEKAKLYIYEHIREQAYDLFGFARLSAKDLFEQLLSVKNVGPKVAIAVLNIGNEEFVRQSIANGEVKLLQGAKGVGKRAAEQIVVELRDKVGVVVGEGAEAVVGRSGVSAQDEAEQALVALGYSDMDAQRALNSIDKSLPTEERIKQALKGGK